MTRTIRIVALPTATEKHERTVQRRVHACMASAVHEMWMGTFTTRDGGGPSEPTPKGALALHLPDPWGKGGATRWFETDAGVLLEAKPVAPVETTRTPRVRVVALDGEYVFHVFHLR